MQDFELLTEKGERTVFLGHRNSLIRLFTIVANPIETRFQAATARGEIKHSVLGSDHEVGYGQRYCRGKGLNACAIGTAVRNQMHGIDVTEAPIT